MSEQKSLGRTTRKGRLSLKSKSGHKPGDEGAQKGAQSIMDLFKRQHVKKQEKAEANDDCDIEILEETKSPYFSPNRSKNMRKTSRLKLSSPKKINLKDLGVEIQPNATPSGNGSPCTMRDTNLTGEEKSKGDHLIGEGISKGNQQQTKRKQLDVSNDPTKRKRLKLPASHRDATASGDTQHLSIENMRDPQKDIKGSDTENSINTQKDCKKEADVETLRVTPKHMKKSDAENWRNTQKEKKESAPDTHKHMKESDTKNVRNTRKDKKESETADLRNTHKILVSDDIGKGKLVAQKETDSHTTASSLQTQNNSEPKLPIKEKIKSKGEAEDGEDENPVEGDDEGETGYRIPYYLENFHTILESVLGDEYYARLFNEEDCKTMTGFQELSEEGQKLYVRLFQRKLRWLRENQIQYPKIAEDLSSLFCELVQKGFLMDERCMSELDDILRTLPAPDLRGLAKSLRLPTSDQRPVIIEAVLKHARKKSIGSFFTAKGQDNNEKNVLKRAKSLLGGCYRVEKERRWVFMRAMMLFSLHNITGDEDEASNNSQLFQMLMTNIGQVTYPKYSLCRRSELFRDRTELLAFCSAVQTATDLREAVEGNQLTEALCLYRACKPLADAVFKDKETTKHVGALPEHLRWYTVGAMYMRALTQGVEALQKDRDYSGAVDQLRELLAQTTYHTDYRGRWYERLALNLHTHLKQPAKALEVIKQGLEDPYVRVGHRLAIWQRAQKICTTPGLKKLHHHWDDFKDDRMAAVKESPKETIEGRQLSVPGAMSSWCTEDSCLDGSGDVTFLRHVEDVALRHYVQHGYPQGLHGEGGTVSVFFSLLLWDALFMDVPDAFFNPYQSAPLDLYTDDFYRHRQTAIDDKLTWLRQAPLEEIVVEFERSWTEHENTFCTGIHWQRFEDVDHAKGLLRCFGGKILSLMFERMVKNLRFTRSGFPDLIVWNTDTQQFKVVEVKGPGDRLSTKQILWLDFLNEIEVDAQVCYVVAVGAKKLRGLRK